eukprot:745934-Hanusia_phi.AAC.2
MQLAWRAFGRRKMAICASSPPHSHHHNTCNFSSAPHGPSLSATNSFTLLHTPCTVARCPVGVPRATAVGTSIIRQSVSSARFMRDTTAVAGIRQFSSLQNKAGKLFVSGWSNCGALGLGKDMERYTPWVITTMENLEIRALEKLHLVEFHPWQPNYIKLVVDADNCLGQHHVLALSDIGEVYSWGWGGSGTPGAGVGALGHGDKSSQPAPKRIENLNGEKITNISCGAKHSVALSQDGTMFTWGHGEQGRLGHGNNTDFLQPEPISDSPKMKWIECGEHFTAAIGLDGTLYTWGKNKVGELGLEGMSVFAQESSCIGNPHWMWPSGGQSCCKSRAAVILLDQESSLSVLYANWAVWQPVKHQVAKGAVVTFAASLCSCLSCCETKFDYIIASHPTVPHLHRRASHARGPIAVPIISRLLTVSSSSSCRYKDT